ncbi:hypothetical protein C4D60_Mb00t02140 [Musa balbisiana]|uniref:Uncharacterized protein n=1 Tax=Musa balbisiana TaxID=52838 RepID=A0A4S8I5F6_MUSBA|nr:hypothetical protein C4D60_Mb00t02140 [Musa balbisiana]
MSKEQAKASNQLDAWSTTLEEAGRSQVTIAFSTLKRMGETEYPNSLIYLVEELCTGTQQGSTQLSQPHTKVRALGEIYGRGLKRSTVLLSSGDPHGSDCEGRSSNHCTILLIVCTTQSRRDWPFLLSTCPKYGLQVEKERERGEYEMVAKKPSPWPFRNC